MTNQKLTHFDIDGDAHMVDVGEKARTLRSAIAEGYIGMDANTRNLIESGGHKKGDVLSIARLAGIMGAKQTSNFKQKVSNFNLLKSEVLKLRSAKSRSFEVSKFEVSKFCCPPLGS